MNDQPQGEGHPHQQAVDDVAKAVNVAEFKAGALLAANVGPLHNAILKFGRACDINPSLLAEAHQHVGEASQMIAAGLERLKAAHDALEKVRCDKGLPAPTPSGGGGGK